ncbi:MAG: S24 family peptidase [Treponemataceae bacterium]|nr:S24 family peptidase [Treponemataceae bacterium]
MFRQEGVLQEAPQQIPLLRQSVSCGPGQQWEDGDAIESYIDITGFVPALRTAKVYAFPVHGMSMIGAGISSGDIVLLDGTQREGLDDDIYVFAWNGSVYCKLLKFDSFSRKVQIYSVHSSELEKAELLKSLDADDPQLAENFHIFGKVLAWIHENRLMSR